MQISLTQYQVARFLYCGVAIVVVLAQFLRQNCKEIRGQVHSNISSKSTWAAQWLIIKGIVRQTMKILSSFTHTHVIPNLFSLQWNTKEDILMNGVN